MKYWLAQSGCKVSGLIEMFEETIGDLGFKIIENPAYESSDMIGYIITKKKLTKKQLRKILEDCFDYYED